MQSLNATRQAGSQPVLDTCSSRYPFELASQYKWDRHLYIWRLRREATPSGGGCCRVAATAACHVSQCAIIITNDQMSIFRGNICFLHSVQLYFKSPSLSSLYLFPSCPIQRYRSVLSLNKWNLLLTVSDPNYTYRLFISIHTHTHTCRLRSSRSQHGKATLCSMYLLSSLDSQRNWLIDSLSVPLSLAQSVPLSVWLLSFKRFNCAKRRLQSEDAAQPQIMYLCIWS